MVRLKTSHAFTLPELLLVTGILSFSLCAVLLTFINAVTLNESSRNLITATAHGEYVMESIKNNAFSSLVTNIGGGTWTWNTATVTANGLTALNNESITTTSSGANPVDVIVTVSWRDTHARSRTKILRTLISA